MTSPGRLLGRHRRTLFAVAGVLFAGIAAALMPPPAALAEAGTRAGVAALVSAAIVASATLPFLIWRSAARPVLWIALAVAALVAGVASFAVSGYAERTCTARYAGKPVVIGMELTPLGAAYKQANPELANDDLLFDAAGVAERIWTPSSIGRCRAFTGGTYFLAIPFLVVCLLATAEAVPATILSPGAVGRRSFDAGRRDRRGAIRRLRQLPARSHRPRVRHGARRRARSRRVSRGDRRARLPRKRELPAGNGALHP